MAEEKKFLDETMEQPKNKKLVVKNVVLAFVIFVILLLCVLAWFTSRSDASASGLSLKTSGENGLEVSLDGGKTWSTKWSSRVEEGYVKSDSLAKYDSTNGGSLMQLLSGNGQDLYYTKSVDANGDVNDSDFEKVSDDKAGDYCLEFEAYFRSENKSAVSLTSESSVLPYDLTDTARNNSFGFSPDYIAGAARVAFLEEGGTESAPTLTKTGLWIPNPKYQLTTTTSENVSYTKMPDNFGGSVDISSGGQPTDPSGTGDYYLWTLNPEFTLDQGNTVEYNRAALRNLNSIPLERIGSTSTYYCQFYTVIPQVGRKEQMIMINQSKENWQETAKSESSLRNYIGGLSNSADLNVGWWSGGSYNVSVEYDGDKAGFDYNTYYFWQINYGSSVIDQNARKLVRIEYDSSTKQITLCNPDKSDVIISAPEGSGVLSKGEKIVVTQEPTVGLSADLSGDDPKISENDNSLCDLEVATVNNQGNHDCSYKFKNALGKYLAVVDDELTVVDTEAEASYFYVLFGSEVESEGEANITDKLLGYIDRTGSSPVTKYVVYNSSTNKFELSTSYGTDRYMIYQKTTTGVKNYGMLTDGTPETEDEDWGKDYYYFDGVTKASLESSEYKTSPSSCTNLVKLTTVDTDMEPGKTYYTGKMKVRIYAEGFDREAQKPMEKGKIKVNLQFTATTIS
ncbi:MAG: hypothetical protein ACI4RL_00980 [Ruminococcus sp.]